MDEMQATVVRAFKTVEQALGVLQGTPDCQSRTKALHGWRVAHTEELAQLTKEIKRYPLDQLKPLILVEQKNHPGFDQAFELVKKCERDADFLAEWKVVWDLFGG